MCYAMSMHFRLKLQHNTISLYSSLQNDEFSYGVSMQGRSQLIRSQQKGVFLIKIGVPYMSI